MRPAPLRADESARLHLQAVHSRQAVGDLFFRPLKGRFPAPLKIIAQQVILHKNIFRFFHELGIQHIVVIITVILCAQIQGEFFLY